MAAAPRTTWILSAAAIATLGLLAFATCGREPGAPQVPRPDSPETVTAAPKTPVAGTRRARQLPRPETTSTTPEASRTATTVDQSDSSASEESEVDEFPGVDVEVVGFDGRPVNGAGIYALPAGRQWKDGDPEPPNTESGADGRCRLRALHAGRYDVGATSGALHALVTDVDLPRKDVVRLALPEGVAVVVRFEQPLFADSPHTAHMRFEVEGGPWSPYPGRGAAPKWETSGFINDQTTEWTAVVQRGARCRFFAPFDDYVVRPAHVTAPAEIHVTRDDRLNAKLRVAFDPPTATFSHPYVIRLEISADDDASTKTWSIPYAANAPVALPDDSRFEFRAPSSSGTFRWHGDGVIAGSTAFRGLTKDGANEIVLSIRVARDAPIPSPEEIGEGDSPRIRRTVRVKGGGDADAQTFRCLVDEHGRWDGRDKGTDDAELEQSGARWAIARRGDWFAGPVDVGREEDGAVDLTMRRGGYVVVVPQWRLPPESLGELTVARKDGAPMFGEEYQVNIRHPLKVGAVLGPFADGPVAFVVRLGDEVVGEATATVRVGGYEPLRIPRITPR